MGKSYYIYQADVFCEECGSEICQDLQEAGLYPKGATTERFDGAIFLDERMYDSDDYPKGPYPSDMNEADTPQHCGRCNGFLENPLTTEGYRYVKDAIVQGGNNIHTVKEWSEFYGLEINA
jgi:hypothetical protein